MNYLTIILLIGFFFLGFLVLYLLFKQDLKSLRDSMDLTRNSVNNSLLSNTQDIHTRLTQATQVISELKRETGAFAEIGRSMRDLQEYLRSPKLRGNIGEIVLSDLLSQIFPKESYQLQYSFKSGEKVDVIIKTGGGLLPIDSKFPLDNFQKLSHASEAEAPAYKRAFSRDLKKHIKDISGKYILPAEDTLDFALMYIPSESVFYEITRFETLMQFARDSRVYPVSPNTLYATLQTILLSYEGQKVEERAKAVFRLLRALEKDYQKTSTTLSTLGTHLNNAHNKFSDLSQDFSLFGQKLEQTHSLSSDSQDKLSS